MKSEEKKVEKYREVICLSTLKTLLLKKGWGLMNIKITGKDLKATDAIKDYVEKKVERLVKYFGENFETTVTIKCERNEQIADIFVNNDGDTSLYTL